MRNLLRAGACLALPLRMACSEELPTETAHPAGATVSYVTLPAVRFSEIHYDNSGIDTGESLEVSGPAGMDLTGWQVILYNGNGGASYNTRTLSGTIPATCDARGVIVLTYPQDGIQNGSPDGMALVDATGAVVEFLSYEGTFAATNGPANGMTSVDIGAAEGSATTIGHSLQRNGADVWSGPQAATFGACNDDDEPPPPPPPAGTFISEIHYDNFGTDAGETIEIEGPAGTDIDVWQLWLYNGSNGTAYHVRILSGFIPATCDTRGVVAIPFEQDGIQNGSPDGIALVDVTGTVLEFISYEGTFTAIDGPAAGMTSVDIGVAESSTTPIGHSLQKINGVWSGPAVSTFADCNGAGGDPTPTPNSIGFSGRSVADDPPLPVGFQDQLFATLRDGTGAVVETTFTWTTESPAVASIDQNGVFTALAAGTAVLRATATDGTTATISLPTRIATASATAVYEGNAEFGEPADGSPADDFIVRRAQFITSYNPNRGTPNWVSYNLETTHFGGEDRCECFTADPALPASFTVLTTADYTGAGAFHGFGIDRGHMARSFDRSAGSLDNAVTYLFSNIVPQAADNNQGPWAALENELGNMARFQNREVYVIAGVAGNAGTVKDEGKIIIPQSVWKVAVIMDRDEGLADVESWRDLEVIAVLMPNVAGIRTVNWNTYRTSIDAIETATGYDLLALLPDAVERMVETGSRPPVAAVNGPFAAQEGSAIAMSGAGSTDPDADALTYSWDFGDGSTGAGSAVSHTYTQDGTFTVTLTVTDVHGFDDEVTTTAVVSNVAPAIASLAGATLLPGETYSTGGSFTDPGADTWSATVDYGTGAGQQLLPLSGKSFALSHTYAAAGTFTVTVRVRDDDVTSTSTTTVVVKTQLAAVNDLMAAVGELVTDGVLNSGQGNALTAKLRAAAAQIGRGHTVPAVQQLGAFINQVAAFLKTGRLTSDAASALVGDAERVIQAL